MVGIGKVNSTSKALILMPEGFKNSRSFAAERMNDRHGPTASKASFTNQPGGRLGWDSQFHGIADKRRQVISLASEDYLDPRPRQSGRVDELPNILRSI